MNIKEGYLYDEIKAKIRPLDVILFKGNEFVSKMIRKLERSKIKSNYVQYSHCALVVSRDLLNDYRLDPSKLYVFESTMSGHYGNDIYNVDGNAFLGCQLRCLDDLVHAFDKPAKTAVAWLKLKNNPFRDPESKQQTIEKFRQIYDTYNGRKYNINFISLLATVYTSLRPFRRPINKLFKTKDMIFCSQLVAIVYKELGIIPESVNPQNVLPVDLIPSIDKDNEIPISLMKFPVRITTNLHYDENTLVRIS